MIRVEVVLLPEPRSASSARDVLRRAFGQWLAGEEAYLDTALLVVTELVTNAVRHGRSPVTLAVTVDDGRVLLEVQDESPGMPSVRHPGWQSLGGRGLLLVDAMATTWGVRPSGGGKVVWAELPAPRHMLQPSAGVPSGRAGADGLPEAAGVRVAPKV